MLASVPHLKDLASAVSFFKEPDDANLVLSRGDAGAPPQNVTLTTAPLLWSPVPGEELFHGEPQGARIENIPAVRIDHGDAGAGVASEIDDRARRRGLGATARGRGDREREEVPRSADGTTKAHRALLCSTVVPTPAATGSNPATHARRSPAGIGLARW